MSLAPFPAAISRPKTLVIAWIKTLSILVNLKKNVVKRIVIQKVQIRGWLMNLFRLVNEDKYGHHMF